MTVKIDFSKNVAKMKPMHGVGQPPFSGVDFSKFHYLTEAGMPFSRLHDVGGLYGNNRFVDIPNIFRDFSKNPYDPDSYDFAFTDLIVTALVKAEVEPFFRLGVTIENNSYIKAYRIFPPDDYNKWAIICEHVIRHYTEGWANGFHYNIRYWEIWNEPDNGPDYNSNEMWKGSCEDFCRLYDVASKHLKNCFPHLKIGGYASCGFYAITTKNTPTPREQYFLDFFHKFISYIKKHGSPLDFFSWHSYASVSDTMKFADYARQYLDDNGYTETETSCNEWNPEVHLRGTAQHASIIAAMLISMQNHPIDTAMFYDARFGISVYGSLFNPLTGTPFLAYYDFLVFDELYKRGSQVESCTDNENIYALAAENDGDGYVMIANTSENETELNLEMNGKATECYVIDNDHMMSKCELPEKIGGYTVLAIRVECEK